ncbi:MAG: hypothetical protein AAF572_11530, partial [Cyanobacteria bacterium P01_B01_bin.77]
MSIDMGAKELTWQQSVAFTFFEVFDALKRLEISSKEVLQTFEEYGERRVATKTVISNRLNTLLQAAGSFSHSLLRVEAKLAIHERDFLVVLEEIKS